MHDLPCSLYGGFLAVVVWSYLLLGRGGFWKVHKLDLRAAVPEGRPGKIVVIVPARNEAGLVARSITSLLQQTCGDSMHIVLVDDASTDGTAQIAKEAAQRAGKELSLTVLAGSEVPAGWSGKLWAVHQGLEKARALNPGFLLFTDADVVHAPESVATLVAAAQRRNSDLFSRMVKLHCATFAEKLLIPAFVFFFFKLFPPAWIADAGRATAGAAGGCILIRPDALERAGGIAGIRNEIIDDCALARAVKRSGGKVWLGLTALATSARPYESFAKIERMVSRTAFSQLRHSALLLVATLLAMSAIYLLPPALLFSGQLWPTALGAAACAAMVVAYLPMVRFYQLNPLWALTLPLAAIFYAGATVHSALRFWAGFGGEWKGRVQDPARSRK